MFCKRCVLLFIVHIACIQSISFADFPRLSPIQRELSSHGGHETTFAVRSNNAGIMVALKKKDSLKRSPSSLLKCFDDEQIVSLISDNYWDREDSFQQLYSYAHNQASRGYHTRAVDLSQTLSRWLMHGSAKPRSVNSVIVGRLPWLNRYGQSRNETKAEIATTSPVILKVDVSGTMYRCQAAAIGWKADVIEELFRTTQRFIVRNSSNMIQLVSGTGPAFQNWTHCSSDPAVQLCIPFSNYCTTKENERKPLNDGGSGAPVVQIVGVNCSKGEMDLIKCFRLVQRCMKDFLFSSESHSGDISSCNADSMCGDGSEYWIDMAVWVPSVKGTILTSKPMTLSHEAWIPGSISCCNKSLQYCVRIEYNQTNLDVLYRVAEEDMFYAWWKQLSSIV